MAVEIPVVIDIDKAFAEAAKKVPSSIQPLKTSIGKLSDDLVNWQEKINKYKIDGPQWKNAVKNFQAISQALEVANDKFMLFASNEGSIKQMNIQLASLSRRWEEMGAEQKFTATGALTDDAKKLKAEYSKITEEIARTGKTLAQLEAEERRILEIRKKKRQTYLDENRILNATVKTMNVLQAQERILASRLSATPVGTKKYQDLAAKLELVRKEIAAAEAVAKRGGASFRSMGDSAASATTHIQSTTAALRSQGKIVGLLSTYLSGYALIFSGLRFVRNVRETTAELEMQRVALSGILNDTDRATDLFRQIKAAALKSPFEIKDLVTYTKQLAAYRVETDKLFDVTTRLADVSAGLGVDMNRIILAYGQVRAASVLRGQELRQFTEAGIPLVDLLAQKFRDLGREGTTTADVFDLISKRAVSFSMIEEIFNDMTDAGGIFYKMQEKQSETLKGQWMKLRDSITIMYDEIGNTESMHNAMTALIKTANNLTRAWREVANWIKTITATIVTYNLVAKASVLATNSITAAEAKRLAVTKAQTIAMPKFIASILGETAAKKTSIWVTKRLEIAQYKLATSTTVLEKAFWKLWAALISNPYAAAAAAIAALGLGIYTMIKNSREATITIDELEQSISKFNNTVQKSKDVSRLTSIYEELSQKAEKTAEETTELERATKELASSFPSAVTGINSETGALEINIKKVKELADAERELELARLKRDEKRTRQRVKELEDEKNKILAEREAGGRYVYGGATRMGIDPNAKRFVEYTEEDFAKMGDRLVEINEELEPLKKSLHEIEELDFVGPIQKADSKVKSSLSGWRRVLSDIQDEKVKAGAPQLFSPSDIENLEDIPDLWKKVKKGIEDTKKELEALKSIQSTLATEELQKENKLAIDLTEKQLDLYEAIKAAFGFVFGKSSTGSYQKDTFITLMENRMKFMKDFKKGYDDLNKYISAQESLEKQSEIMRARGLSLGIELKDQQRAAKELSQWYQDQIDRVLDEMRGKGLKAPNLTEVLSQQITGESNKSKMLRDYQALLQSLWDAKTDFDTSQLKKELEDEMKRLTDELKRSETARNFFQNILDLTGDEQLAATMAISVYGGAGEDFKKKLQEQLDKAFSSIDTSKVGDGVLDELKKAFEAKDFDTILKYIEVFPEEVRKTLKQMASDDEKYTADLMKNFADLIAKYGDTTQKIATIKAKAENEIQKVKDALDKNLENEKLTPEQRKALQDRAAEIIKALSAQRDLDVFKQSDDYIKFFSEITIMTAKQAAQVRGELRNAYLKAFQDGAITADELRRNLRAVDEQYHKISESSTRFGAYLRDGFEGANNKLQEFADNITVIAAKMKSGKELDAGEQAFASRMLKIFGSGQTKEIKSYQQLIDSFSKNGKGLEEAGEAFQEMGEGMSETAAKGPRALAIINEIIDSLNSGVSGFEQIINQLNEVRGPENQIGGWFKYVSDFTGYMTSGFKKLLSGDPVGAVADVVSSIVSIFTNVQKDKVEKLNKEIEEQKKIVDALGRSYNRLEKAMEDSFGSEYIYNYNEQLKNLQATQEAYLKQAQKEREKGKSSDESKAQEYEQSAEDIAEKISDMRHQLAEYFTETDLTSAAKDFASSWIEAYKEFGSTTDAMKEKFQEFVQSMIEQSLGAKIMQSILQPLFDSIDEMAQTGGELSAQEIAQIGQMAPEYIDKINAAMTNLMTQLTANGYNIRQQMGGFTGISRDIAGASEESITGLAAGINTQNFYMSLISQNVAAILAAMTGETVEGATGATVPDPYKEQVLTYMGSLPQMRDDMYAIRTLLERVIKPLGTNATHYVATRM